MDLKRGIIDILAKYGVSVDTTDPFSVMPREVANIVLKRDGKEVDILKTVKQFFDHPAFVYTDVREVWKSLLSNPDGYISSIARQLNTRIIYVE